MKIKEYLKNKRMQYKKIMKKQKFTKPIITGLILILLGYFLRFSFQISLLDVVRGDFQSKIQNKVWWDIFDFVFVGITAVLFYFKFPYGSYWLALGLMAYGSLYQLGVLYLGLLLAFPGPALSFILATLGHLLIFVNLVSYRAVKIQKKLKIKSYWRHIISPFIFLGLLIIAALLLFVFKKVVGF